MSKVCEEVQEGSALIFGHTRFFSYNEVHGGGKNNSHVKKAQIVQSFRYDAGL